MESFYRRLERLLKDKGISKKDLAEKCGISNNGISTWGVTGAVPRADVAVKIAGILGVSTEYLITGKIPEIDTKDELAYSVSRLSPEKRRVIQVVVDALDVFDT